MTATGLVEHFGIVDHLEVFDNQLGRSFKLHQCKIKVLEPMINSPAHERASHGNATAHFIRLLLLRTTLQQCNVALCGNDFESLIIL